MRTANVVGVLAVLVLAQVNLAAENPAGPFRSTAPASDAGNSVGPRPFTDQGAYFTDSRVSESLRDESESARLTAKQQAESEEASGRGSRGVGSTVSGAREGASAQRGPQSLDESPRQDAAGAASAKWLWWLAVPLLAVMGIALLAARAVWRDERRELD